MRQTAQTVATAVSASRGTTIGAERVDPGVDVAGSEAGNSIDHLFYERGVFAFDLGTGVPRFTGTTSDNAVPTGPQPCFGSVGTGGGQGNCPSSGLLVNEAPLEAAEFADGAFGLFQAALDYADDTTAPDVQATGPAAGQVSVKVGFTADDATDVYYTTDGSTPTTASTRWTPVVPGAPRPLLRITQTATLKWIAVDVKGNTSAVRSKVITIG